MSAPFSRLALRTGGPILLASLLHGCSPESGEPVVEVDASRYEPAIATLFASLVSDARAKPAAATPRARLGMAYEANGLIEPAARSYDQATRLDPAEARWWYHAAIVREALGEPARAVALVDSAIARDGRYAPAHWRRGHWCFALGELEEARRSFRRATELKPQHPAGWLGLARLALKDDDPEEAERLLLDAIERRPGSPFVPYLRQLLGVAYRQQGRLDEAREQLALGRSGRPGFTDNWHDDIDEFRISLTSRLQEAQPLIETGRSDDAVAILEPLLDEHGTNASLLVHLGVAYLALGRLDAARAVLEGCIALHPDDAIAHLNLGQVQSRQGAVEPALVTTERAIELNPRNAAARVQLGKLLEAAGRSREALAAFEEGVRLDPSNVEALRRGAVLAAAFGDEPRAAELNRRAEALAPAGTREHGR